MTQTLGQLKEEGRLRLISVWPVATTVDKDSELIIEQFAERCFSLGKQEAVDYLYDNLKPQHFADGTIYEILQAAVGEKEV